MPRCRVGPKDVATLAQEFFGYAEVISTWPHTSRFMSDRSSPVAANVTSASYDRATSRMRSLFLAIFRHYACFSRPEPNDGKA